MAHVLVTRMPRILSPAKTFPACDKYYMLLENNIYVANMHLVMCGVAGKDGAQRPLRPVTGQVRAYRSFGACLAHLKRIGAEDIVG